VIEHSPTAYTTSNPEFLSCSFETVCHPQPNGNLLLTRTAVGLSLLLVRWCGTRYQTNSEIWHMFRQF